MFENIGTTAQAGYRGKVIKENHHFKSSILGKRMAFVSILSIIVGELLITLLLHFFKTTSSFLGNDFIDSFLLAILLFPAVYYWGIRPLTIQIAERKLAEKALRVSEEKYRYMFAHNPQPMWIYNLETLAFLEVNDAAINHYGYSREEFLSMTIKDIRPIEDIPALLEKVVAPRQMYEFSGEWRHIKKNGEIIFVEITSHTIVLNDRESRNVLVNDITERKQAEVDLIEAKDKAQESDRLKSAFLANISHEIRTPMNGILGFTDLLKEPDFSGEQQQEFIHIIHQSGQRLLNLLNEIIEISKIESGEMGISIAETNINESIQDIYNFFKPQVEKKGIQFSIVNALPAEGSIVKTDSMKVHSILTNLVNNAIKFTSKGFIEFGCKNKDKSLEFFVKDTGQGIHPEQKELIFERFRQGSEALTRNYEGAGLGLSISKAFVKMLGGTIWLESEIGKGSTFYFTIACNTAVVDSSLELI